MIPDSGIGVEVLLQQVPEGKREKNRVHLDLRTADPETEVRRVLDLGASMVGICLMPVTDPETVKNCVHPDLTSSAANRDREIDRLLALGARRIDIGQTGAESWTVLCRS